jgi:hypothetical protein
MRSSIINNTPPPDLAADDNFFALQPDVTLSDQNARQTMATSTSLSAATPRTSRLLPHESSLMEAAIAPNTLNDAELFTYTVDVKQFPACNIQSPTKQSSQLDSMLLSKLPRELRDKIYQDTVVKDKEIPIGVTRYETEGGEQRRRLQIEHPLMRACRQTREEVSDIYYLENTFRITSDLFERRAVEELSSLLTPWAERMTKLGVSHELVRSKDDFAEINFSISASQGRIVVQPESSRVQYGTVAIDIGLATVDSVTMTYDRICFCKAFKLALKHDGSNVVIWMQEYVDLTLKSASQDELSRLFDSVYCWACAGRNVI